MVLTNKQKQKNYRDKKSAKGLREIRGIWAPVEKVDALIVKINEWLEKNQ